MKAPPNISGKPGEPDEDDENEEAEDIVDLEAEEESRKSQRKNAGLPELEDDALPSSQAPKLLFHSCK